MCERTRRLVLVAIPIFVYVNTLMNGFTLDDDAFILHNPAVTAFSIKALFAPAVHNNVFRPITFITFALNWMVGANHAFGYHLVNLLLHGTVTYLVYLVLKKLLENVAQGEIIAWTAALLFAVHPIHTEAVASVSGRSELLVAVFLLTAWILHLTNHPILALTCFALTLLSKESAVVFAPLVLAGDYVRGKLKPIHRYASIAGVTVLYMAILWKVQGDRFGQQRISVLDNPLAHLSAGLRILNAIRVGWKYIGLQIYPARFSCDYSYQAIPLDSTWWKISLTVLCAAIVIGLWIWALVSKRREWFLAGALYLIPFAITGNILLPIGTILGERLAYLPSVGFCLFVILLWIPLLKHSPRSAWAVIVTITVLASVRTTIRNQDWHDDFTLFSADVQAAPGSAKLHAMLGGQYMLRGRWDLAHREFETAVRIYPNYPEVIELCGIIESRMGQDQEALQSLQKARSVAEMGSVTYDSITIDLAAHLVKLGRSDDALSLMNELIENSPGYSPAWSNRAAIHYGRGEFALASQDATVALRLDPANVQAQKLLPLFQSFPVVPN